MMQKKQRLDIAFKISRIDRYLLYLMFQYIITKINIILKLMKFLSPFRSIHSDSGQLINKPKSNYN